MFWWNAAMLFLLHLSMAALAVRQDWGTEYTHTHTHTHTHTPLYRKVYQPWSKSKMHYLPSTSYCLSTMPKSYLLNAVIRNLWLPKQRKFSARRQKSMSNACLGECREIALHIWLFVIPWTVACQAPLSMGFFRQEYWRGLLFSSFRGSSQPRDRTHISYVSCTGRWVLYH